ncbi:MAG: hypothetical protein KGM96_13340 [Acidobacteriota bacterium]|nr:hypothetical protein [Acidobacteriota bacterium]
MDWLWESLEYLGEILVFIGVVGEVLTERELVLKDDEEKRDAIEGVSSWILVAGLAISLSALIGTNEYFNGTIAALNLQAVKARREADSFQSQIADSTARTKEAEAKVASAEAESEDAMAKVATADVRIADAEERAAKANQSAEEERIERLKLEAQIAPRRLTNEEARDILGACTLCAGRSVTIRSYATDVESAFLAKQLVMLLGAAKMNVRDAVASSNPVGAFLIGIHITGDDALASEVRSLLSDRGHLDVAPKGSEGAHGWEMRTGPSTPTDIEIVVGPKPIK